MKTKNSDWIVSLFLIGSLSLSNWVAAQDAAVPTNAPTAIQSPAATAAPEPAAPEPAPVTPKAPEAQAAPAEHWTQPRQIVLIGQDAELKAGETADVVVVIGGSAKVHGRVRDACVVIGGTLEVDSEVGDATVAVLGDVKLGPNAHVHRDAVAVLGSLTIAPGAHVEHDAVSVGGKLDLGEGAQIGGEKVNVGLPIAFPKIDWLSKWLRYCVFEFRPLAPQVGWIWIVAGFFFLFYFLIAAVFPRPVQVCLDNLTNRPATTFFVGLLVKLLSPLVILILLATGIGIFVIPFVSAALFLGAILGKVALLEWLGLQIGRHFGWQKPLLAFLIGSIILTLLYMVPVLGMLTYMIFSVWGLGCAITSAFSSMRRERPEPPVAQPPFSPVPPVSEPVATAAVAAATVMNFAAATNAPLEATTPPLISPNAPTSEPAAAPKTIGPIGSIPIQRAATNISLPRAGFWERMGAAFLDAILIILLSALGRLGPLGFLLALAYFAGMWTWKGTTIGGIVLKLQVVRHDGGQLTFLVALVRALAAAFSAFVLFLGFFWIGWDRDKQGWHDKIAGTIVVRLPHSMPLVCL